MKIMMLASRPLEHSGITKIEMDVIERIRPLCEILVACSFGFDNEYGELLKENGIKCITLPSKKKTFSYMKAIKRGIKKENIDEVYINGNSAMMFFDALPSKMAGARVVTHCHNTKSDFPIVNYLAKPVFNMIVDKKIGVSELASKWAYMGKNIVTIPNGIDLNRFYIDTEDREGIRKQLNVERKHVYGHMGTFNNQKNHKRLIDIFNTIQKKDDKAVLLLIGDGELKTDIKNKVETLKLSSKVIFVDFTNNPERYFRAMDLAIIPSVYEGFCMAALEAQACGAPVLTSDVFPEEIYVTDRCQRLSLSKTDDEWAEKAISMLGYEQYDISKMIKDKNMDHDSMINSIINILLDK